MGSADSPAQQQSAGPREVALVAVLLPLLFLIQIAITGSWAALTRKFWLDELLTRARVCDPSLGHFFESLGASFDCNPPAYYLLLRAGTVLTPGADEVSLRLFSLLGAWAALVGLYVIVRRVLSPLLAVVAVLATWAHPMVIEYALEARGYIWWLAFAIWFAYFLNRSVAAGRWGWSDACVGLTAVLLCTVHWFGIISLGLVAVAQFLFGGHPIRARLRALIPVALGPLSLLACVPILLRQRSELTVTTWIPAPTPRLILRFLGDLIPMLVVLAVLVVWTAHMLLPRLRQAPTMPTEQARGSRDLAGLLGLSLLPLVIVVLSYLVQPSIQPKYALPTVAVFGPLIAWLFSRASRPAAVGLCLLLLVVSAAELWRLAEVRRQFNGQIDQLITILRTHGDDAPLVIEDRGILYAISYYAPELAPRCHGFYFDDERPGGLNPSLVHERELGLSFERFYGQPRFLRLSDLRGEAHFFVVPIGTNAAQIGEWLASDYPGFQARLVTDGLYELKPSENAPSGPAAGSAR